MTEKLYSAPITSAGMKNALMKARQLTDLSWVPLIGTIPKVSKKDGERIYLHYNKGEEYKGIPYSSVYEKNTYVGSNISIETFISATCNPNSFLYTRDLREECNEPKAVPFYGTVCSKFVQTVLGINENYNTAHFEKIDGMRKMFSAGGYSAEELKRCDVLLCAGKHTAMVTDILKNENDEILYIEVSEETTNPSMQRKKWNTEEFFSHFEKYDVLRYEYLDKVPYEHSPFVNVFDEKYVLDSREYDVLTRRGDKCNIPVGEEITLDVLTDGWEKYKIFKDGKLFFEAEISKEIQPGHLCPGYYQVLLVSGEKESRPCFFCITECVLKARNDGEGKVRISYSYSSGEPIWVQVGTIGESFFSKTDATGDEVVYYDLSVVKTKKVRIAFKNEYGVYVSKYELF